MSAHLVRALHEVRKKIHALQEDAWMLAVGKRVRVISNFNGQPLGNSKKSLKGKEFTITWVHVSGNEISFMLAGVLGAACGLEDIEFI